MQPPFAIAQGNAVVGWGALVFLVPSVLAPIHFHYTRRANEAAATDGMQEPTLAVCRNPECAHLEVDHYAGVRACAACFCGAMR